MIDPPNLHEAAVRFGAPIRLGVMSYADCHDLLCQAAIAHPIARKISPDQFADLCDRLARTLAAATDDPQLAVSQNVRDAIRPLFSARATRDAIELTAFRTAGDMLNVAEIHAVIRDELAAHVASRKQNNAR